MKGVWRGLFGAWKEALEMILKPTPQERAMKMQQVVRALSGELTWIQAADLMAVSVRTWSRTHS